MRKEQKDSFSVHAITHIDYKDVELLQKFVNPHARVLSRKKTGLSARAQRTLAVAIKRARFMALMPYVAQ